MGWNKDVLDGEKNEQLTIGGGGIGYLGLESIFNSDILLFGM